MGSTRLDRELMRARTAYTVAARQLNAAMEHLYELGVPIFTRDTWPEPWSAEDVQAVLDVQAAWNELVKARKPYDQLYREYHRGGW